jgi:signal transduction histidine kinase
MKLNTVENVIERSGDLRDEENFTIALTAKAIEVLSSQIYKDAQLAIVRELGTNAADSHIEAGKKDVPFDVTLPNNMVPELVIRDYGTGMAYEKVMTMYRTYFGSDKTHSNEVTGCLGLGSKSPLAYTDQFQVTSWYGGTWACRPIVDP